MAVTLQLTLHADEAQRNIRALQQRAPIAIARALNRAAGSANTVMVREVSRDMGLKQADTRQFITIRRATPSRLQADVVAKSARVPLIRFNARDRRPRGVSARMPGGAGRYPHAFIATMRSGHTGVFQRKQGVPRLPIRELHGPSVPHVFHKHIDAGMRRGEEQLVKNLQHELRFAAAQLAA